ncbi:cysteine protease StiP family protein [Klebsiella aerogenes]
MHKLHHFSGAFAQNDVRFLLNPVNIAMTSVDEKEALIQSGKAHYSDLLSQEPTPSQWHLNLFAKALQRETPRMANEVQQLCHTLIAQFNNTPIILVSLVRAGVPLGVMLQRALRDAGKTSFHYGISIIRDRGIDSAALEWIENRHGTQGIVFVDGWTGKGAIRSQLQRSLHGRKGYPAEPRLVVLADPCGCAWLSASDDDWLIPFGIMGAPVSGLISRSLWSPVGFHGCVQCDHLADFECGQLLVDTVDNYRQALVSAAQIKPDLAQKARLRRKSEAVVLHLAERYAVDNLNRIKPGIAEATRAVLRRVPDHVLVRAINDPDVALLMALARDKGIHISEVGDEIGQYRAVTIIKKVF